MKKILPLLVWMVWGQLVAQNQNISNGFIFDGEPFLAVNPADGQHLVAAWMGFVPFNNISIKTTVSTDGGASWSSPAHLPHVNSAFGSADPIVGFDAQGNVLVTYIDFSFSLAAGAIYCVRSTDGGLSWGSPVEVIDFNADPNKTPIDRPWMVIDRSGGPHDGTVYVTSMSAGTNDPNIVPPYHPYLTHSSDGGLSFKPFRRLDTLNYESGSLIATPMPSPAIGSNGKFYAAYPAYDPGVNVFPRAVLTSSVDGGTTIQYTERNLVMPGFTNEDAKRASLLRVDPTDADHLVSIFLSTLHGDADVFLMETFDAGANWTGATRINDDPIGNDRMQDMLWADFDDDGDLVVTWRDRRNGSDSTYQTASEIWGAVRLKTKSTFEPNFSLTDNLVPYDTILASSGNDFMCVQLQDDTISAVWGDARTGRLNIWFQRRDMNGVVLSNQLVASESVPEVEAGPNPVADRLRVRGEGLRSLRLLDGQGRVLRQEPSPEEEDVLDTEALATGLYWLEVETDRGRVVVKIAKD